MKTYNELHSKQGIVKKQNQDLNIYNITNEDQGKYSYIKPLITRTLENQKAVKENKKTLWAHHF